MKAYFGTTEPEPIKYTRNFLTGLADVWLRKNIEQFDVEDENMDEEGNPSGEKTTHKEWRADEVFLSTKLSKASILANFDNIYYSAGAQPTLEERLEVIEGLLGEIVEG